MAKYVCPICGKIWYNTSDLAKCVTACDKAAIEASAKKEETLRKKAADTLALNKAKEAVQTAYENLKKTITEYNDKAATYTSTYGNGVSLCTSALSWQEAKYPWGNKEKREEFKSTYAVNKDDLSKLIDSIFNF